MVILGINAYHGDAAAALLIDGELVAAAEEERFTRIKHWAGFPTQAIRSCLAEAGISIRAIDHIAISRDPKVHRLRKVWTLLRHPDPVAFLRQRLQVLFQVRDLRSILAEAFDMPREAIKAQIHHVEHHQAHLASAFLVSPFDEAACLSIDGFGDFVSVMQARGEGITLRVLDWVGFPHSIGIVYTAMTQYLGFSEYGDEYKVMALAAYGEPGYLDQMHQIVQQQADGQFRLDLSYFQHHQDGDVMSWARGEPVFGQLFSHDWGSLFGPPRQPGEPIEPRHQDLAASLQAWLEETVFGLLEDLHHKTKLTDLCLAGGVAFNSVMNGKILQSTSFRRLFIQPVAGDAGTALGAACFVWHQLLAQPRRFHLTHLFWGPQFSEYQIQQALQRAGCKWERLGEEALIERATQVLTSGSIVGWFQDRMEFGPRALGHRSLLADPRDARVRERLNQRIKHREAFRPFAPAVLDEVVDRYFDSQGPEPFMIRVLRAKPEAVTQIPAVVHVDGTSRVQTVDRETNPLFWRLIQAFGQRTGIFALLNTSFNEQEPIVCTPEEAIECFLRTDLDALGMGPYWIEKHG